MIPVLIILAALALMALPFLPIRLPFTLAWFNYPLENRPKNIIYILVTALVTLVTVVLMPYILNLADWFASLDFVAWLIGLVPVYAQYSMVIFRAVFANVVYCAAVILSHYLAGMFLGLFKWFPNIIQGVKDWFLRIKESLKKNDKDKKDEKKDEDKQVPKEEALPAHLFPEPEKKDFSSKVKILGKKQRQDTGAKRRAARDKRDPKEETRKTVGDEAQFSFRQMVEMAVGLFYVKQGDVWYVQPQCKKVAKHLRNFLVLAGFTYLVIFTLLMIPIFFPVQIFAEPYYQVMVALVDTCYLYPTVSLVLLTEIFWFMNGRLPEEPVEEPQQARRSQNGYIVDLDQVEQALMHKLGKDFEVKSFYTGDIEGQEQSRFPLDISGDPTLENILAFVKSQHLLRNDDYLRGIQALQRGRDVLFDAPLYTAVGMYLYPYLNARISRGERIVVICLNRGDIPGIIANLREGFRQVTRSHTCLWEITDRQQMRTEDQTDILVLSPEDFLDDRLPDQAGDFFRRVTIALFPDADRVVKLNNYLCLIISQFLKRHTNDHDVQYIFHATRHTQNLAGSLTEHFMLKQDVHTAHASYAYGSLRLYVWKASSGCHILDNSAQAVQLESEIAGIAQEFGIPNVTLVTSNALFPNQVDQGWLDAYDIFQRPIGFTVVADKSCNLPGTIYAYSRYVGREASVLHVIAPPYLLRDYFYDQAARSVFEHPPMEQNMAEHAKMLHSSMILLLCRLMQGISAADFASRMSALTGKELPEKLTHSAIRGLVLDCMELAFGPEAAACHADFSLLRRTDSQFRDEFYIQIREDGILDQLLRETELVTVKPSGALAPIRLPLFRKMLAQKYLPGQYLVVNNTNYEIKRIDYQRGIIHVDSPRVTFNVPSEYVQAREYTLPDAKAFREFCNVYADAIPDHTPDGILTDHLSFPGDSVLNSLSMVRSLGTMSIESHTVAYYDTTRSQGLLNLSDNSVTRSRADMRRTVDQALYLRFSGDFVRSDRTTMTLAILLQEMMKTIFPDEHFCVSVCPILEDQDRFLQGLDAHSRRIAEMYPKLYGWGTPSENCVELLIVDDCQGGTGVLDMLFAPQGTFLGNLMHVLYDYLLWLKDRTDGSYLCFGAKECPALYDLNGVRDLLEPFYGHLNREHDMLQDLKARNSCAFCGKQLNMGESYLWNNRKSICQECHEEHIPTPEEAGLILKHVRKYLEERFGVSLPGEITTTQDTAAETSHLDVESKCIRLNPQLPLTAVHSELAKQLVRLWQLENLRMTGEPEFEGQVLYVLLQYLQELEQHQTRKRFHSQALLNSDPASLGYGSLRQALLARNTDNSFQYMLEMYPKGSSPVRKSIQKRSTRNIDPSKVARTFRDSLSADEQKAYELIRDGLLAMAAEIPLNGTSVAVERLGVVWESVCSDYPEIDWVYHYRYSYNSNRIVTSVTPMYNMDDTERQSRQSELDKVTGEMLAKLPADGGDYDIALAAYQLLAMEMDYDSIALDQQKRYRKELEKQGRMFDKPDDLRSVYGALVQKKAVCAGYAVAFQYLMQKMGIECAYVRGHCHQRGYHAWNIVKLEGSYYHVDATWGDGSNTDPTRNRNHPSYNYFCVTDTDIRLSRDIDAQPPSPPCTDTACNYYIREGLFFDAYDHMAIKQRLLSLLEDPDTARLDLRFANAQVLEAAKRYLLTNGGIYELLRASGRSELEECFGDNYLPILTFIFTPGPKKEKPEEKKNEQNQDPQPPIPEP